MAGKGLIREQLYAQVYNEIAEKVLLHKNIKIGEDGYIDPDHGRSMTRAIADRMMNFITPLEVQLNLLRAKGYVAFQFKNICHDYYKVAFACFKEDGSQNFSRAEDDIGTGAIWFKGKLMEEAVYNAITHEGLMFGPGTVAA